MSIKNINNSNSNSDLLKNNNNKDSIPCRIEIIKDLMTNKDLNCLIDFNDDGSNSFLNSKDDNESNNSYNTRIILKKRIHNFNTVITQLGGRLKYIKSGTTGHTFMGITTDKYGEFAYAVKVVAYPKKDRYGTVTDTRRPENAELMMIKLLSYFVLKNQTPHIVLPIGTFDTTISTFVDLIERNVVSKENKKYNEFIKKYNAGQYHENASILISEWSNRGDLVDFINKNYKYLTLKHWKVIFFQILSVLAVIQTKYPGFRHNDLKANNILVHKITSKKHNFEYTIANTVYRVPNIGYHIKIWDFDFACIPGIVDNKKVDAGWTNEINVSPIENKYYDVHYFFNTLIGKAFCKEIIYSKYIDQEIRDFIERIVPEKYRKLGTQYIHERGRILVNDEYLTPKNILKNDPFFDEYKIIKTKKNTQLERPVTADLPKVNNFLKHDNNSHESEDINITKLLTGGKYTLENTQKIKKQSKQKKEKSRTISEELKEIDSNIL